MPPTIQSVGPGFLLSVHTDYPGQIDPSTFVWIVDVEGLPLNESGGNWRVAIPAHQQNDFLNLSGLQQATNAPSLAANQNVQLSVSLVEDTVGDVDAFYSQPGWTWDPTANLAMVIQANSQGGTQGGFTADDRATIDATAVTTTETNQLAQAINAATTAVINIGTSLVSLPIGQILSSNASDALRLADLGGGVTCDRIDVDISRGNFYGVVVRVTQYPDTAVFRTPDAAWSFSDLAVLTVTRGGDVLARHGIHTTSHTMVPLPETPYPWLTNFGIPIQPSDYHVSVDWAAGVCGELLGLVLP
jgi:hypothetical protein